MEIRFLMTARFAEVSPHDGTYTIVGGDFDRIDPPGYPATHPLLHVVCKVVLGREECERSHSFRAAILDERGEPIAETLEGQTGPLPMEDEEASRRSLSMILGFGHVIFPAPGWYRVEFTLDGELTAHAPIRLMPPGGTQTTEKLQIGQRVIPPRASALLEPPEGAQLMKPPEGGQLLVGERPPRPPAPDPGTTARGDDRGIIVP